MLLPLVNIKSLKIFMEIKHIIYEVITMIRLIILYKYFIKRTLQI